MQLNFLQEDLLAAIQKESASAPSSVLQRTAIRRVPLQQASLLDDLPSPSVKQSKAVGVPEPVPMIEVADEVKSSSAFKTISEAAEALDVPAYVLRFWESQFTQIKPTKSRGGRRYYRPEDMEILVAIKTLLYQQGYTIKGARKALQHMKQGVKLSEQPVPVTVRASESIPVITPRQKTQLAAIRAELLSLQQHLVPYL